MGLISFRTVDDRIDYVGFQRSGHDWCDDLFNHYRDQATDVWPHELIEKMYREIGFKPGTHRV